MSSDLERLAETVKARRLFLGLARLAAAKSAGVSKDTWQRVEEGEPVRAMNYAKIERVLGWAPGSCSAILEGRTEVEVEEVPGAPGAVMSPISHEDLAEGAQSVVQLSMIATAGNLTADEIREMSKRVVQDLKAHGYI